MIYDNLEFHNVMELQKKDGFSGLRLQRFPEEIRYSLGYEDDKRGRIASQTSTGCEVRFVTDSKKIRLYLSALDGDGEVLVYNGNFYYGKYTLKSGVITTIHLEADERFEEVNPEILQGYSFSHKVWRIAMNRGFSAVYHGIDVCGCTIRPPKENEVPKLRWLAYGSSITHGVESISHNNSYVEQAAKRLGVDVLCNGISGACLCEKEVADYMATRNDWDFITLELGVNMRVHFEPEEFEKRARYIIKKVIENNPDKPVIIITIFPNRSLYLKQPDKIYYRNIEYNKILNEIHREFNANNLHIIQGDSILTNFSGLSSDLLHPSDDGHILMGENLAKKLKEIIAN
ncbi:lysophospholipase L1-like esterase [Natranaerovirga pectinivora]|uniref:Lysophospholipase L1-like esterase n=1 Tax=Natranaerovirga pectinivora TaxID=682400 RepID=A0A4R3MR02_9FIRM|nr:SGNH/GDSL hydrolase family protein [Natranaerovirga pectinivora]TCT16356.1 lysophospholipase L1-like esterase [Natranaerovirga pectinivora]